jgi:6-phosphogluconolactonase
MTLTYPILNRSRRILWLVTGEDKVVALAQLKSGDTSIPAGRVNQQHATILADQSAAAKL